MAKEGQHSAETGASQSARSHQLAEKQSPSTEGGREKASPPVNSIKSALFRVNYDLMVQLFKVISCISFFYSFGV